RAPPQCESARWPAHLLHRLLELLLDSLGGEPAHRRCAARDGREGLRLDVELEARRESDRTQRAQPILPHARIRVANGADDAARKIGATLEGIAQLITRRGVRDGVDREITTRQILVEGRAELHLGVPAIGLDVAAKGL